MEIDDTIRGYMRMKGKSATQVAKEIGTTPQNLNKKLKTQSIKYKEAIEIARHLGYEVVWLDVNTNKIERPPQK